MHQIKKEEDVLALSSSLGIRKKNRGGSFGTSREIMKSYVYMTVHETFRIIQR
jgi:hypothetical protein